MKRLFLLLVLVVLTFSCDDECTQTAYCEVVSSSTAKSGDRVMVCHKGKALEIDKDSLKEHLSHGDTEGDCLTLSSTGLEFRDGEYVKIPCSYLLPFIYVDDSGKSWLYKEFK